MRFKLLNRKRVFIGLVILLLALAGAIFSRALTLISQIPKDENLAVAMRVQTPPEWYRSAILSKFFLEDEMSSTWCNLQLLKKDGLETVYVLQAKLIYLLQIYEAYRSGLFQDVDIDLLQRLIDTGIARCDLNRQLNPPDDFKEFLGAHRALVYASMSGDREIYDKLIEHGARTDFFVTSAVGVSIPFAEFHRNRNPR
jgi:hypothetical protein